MRIQVRSSDIKAKNSEQKAKIAMTRLKTAVNPDGKNPGAWEGTKAGLKFAAEELFADHSSGANTPKASKKNVNVKSEDAINTQDTMKNASPVDNDEPVITDILPEFKPFVPTKDFWKKQNVA